MEDIYDNDAKEGGGESRMGELAKSALDVLAETLLSDENLQRKINNACTPRGRQNWIRTCH